VKNKVSELMDGELDQQAAVNIIAALKKNDQLRENWETYHLIGDTLRQPSKLSINVSHKIKAQLINEPTVLSPQMPQNLQRQKYKVFAFSIAASLIAMVTGWIAIQNLYQPQQIMMAERSNKESIMPVVPVKVSNPPSSFVYQHPPVEINDYLFVHREFLPGTTTQELTTYVHPVNETYERYAR